MGQTISKDPRGHAPVISCTSNFDSFSVVIPALNEVDNIGLSLNRVLSGSAQPEVVLVDGGSTDGTPQKAASAGAKVITSAKGRGRQLNAGWRATQGDWCLFLHADTLLPEHYPQLIQSAMQQQAAKGQPAHWGCFCTIKTDMKNKYTSSLLSWGVGVRTRFFNQPYGDQAIWIHRQCLEELGGFKEWPLLEDLEMVQRLRRISPPAIVPQPVVTSARRWERLGFWQTTALNQVILVGYRLGVDVDTLARWYYKGAISLSKQANKNKDK